MNQLRAERDDHECDVEPLNVAWVAAGAGALNEKIVDPEDPEGPPVRRCETKAVKRKRAATWAAKPQAHPVTTTSGPAASATLTQAIIKSGRPGYRTWRRRRPTPGRGLGESVCQCKYSLCSIVVAVWRRELHWHCF